MGTFLHTHAHRASPCIKRCVIHETLGGLASAADGKQEEGVPPAVRGCSHCARQPASKAGPPGCPERSMALRTEAGSCSLSGARSMEGCPSVPKGPCSVLGGHFLKGTWACVEKRKDDAENTVQGTAEATKRTFPPRQQRGGTE